MEGIKEDDVLFGGVELIEDVRDAVAEFGEAARQGTGDDEADEEVPTVRIEFLGVILHDLADHRIVAHIDRVERVRRGDEGEDGDEEEAEPDEMVREPFP